MITPTKPSYLIVKHPANINEKPIIIKFRCVANMISEFLPKNTNKRFFEKKSFANIITP